jgi:hypothetical protein
MFDWLEALFDLMEPHPLEESFKRIAYRVSLVLVGGAILLVIFILGLIL